MSPDLRLKIALAGVELERAKVRHKRAGIKWLALEEGTDDEFTAYMALNRARGVVAGIRRVIKILESVEDEQ